MHYHPLYDCEDQAITHALPHIKSMTVHLGLIVFGLVRDNVSVEAYISGRGPYSNGLLI